MEQEKSFAGLIGMLRSSGAVARARQQEGVDLLDERMIKELEEEWGGPDLVRKVTYKAFLLTGTPRPTPTPPVAAGAALDHEE